MEAGLTPLPRHRIPPGLPSFARHELGSSGLEALGRVRDARPHVVLLDVALPTMNGLEVLLCIRQLDPTVAVIMVSGVSDAMTLHRALTLGAADYLVKPMKLQEVERSLAHVLEHTLLDRVRAVPV